jgi:diguanylate cyclase (GGDEF)-like protein
MIHPDSAQRSSDEALPTSPRDALGSAFPALGLLLLEHCARSATPLAIKDIASGRYVWVNAAMAALFDRAAPELVGQGDAQLMPGVPVTSLRSAEQAALADPHGALSEHRIDSPAGVREFNVLRLPLAMASEAEPRYLAALWSEVGGARSRDARLAAALAQIEAQQRAYETLRRERQDELLHDPDTGLYRGAHFDDLMRREVDLSSREHREFALVIVALDAPAAGTERSAEARQRMVEAIAGQLRNRTRAMDASCRLGDERFAVLLSGVGLATAHARMENLRRQCASEIVVQDGRDLAFSVSMGVASFPHTADAQQPLLAAAVQALAEAARRGGNQIALASIRFDAD